jgi:hypothetical protein
MLIDVKKLEFEADEKIIQVAVGTGGDGRPFLMHLTNKGRVFSSAIHGQGNWEVTELPKRKELIERNVTSSCWCGCHDET